MKIGSISGGNTIARSKLKDKKNVGLKFNILHEEAESPEEVIVDNLSKLHNTNPFLALQQLDYHQEDEQAKFITASEKLMDHLNQLLLRITQGQLNKEDIIALHNTIEQNRFKFNNLELQDLYDEIYLRASIELAKLSR